MPSIGPLEIGKGIRDPKTSVAQLHERGEDSEAGAGAESTVRPTTGA